ncbi:hypothetical protein PROFUN_06503 [Planoprotostelium fungivorum]|uniref:LRR receptor-like serine/threonine-protein kinase n=1 Tax=Planoprotostelium fungivorum TaxID=1890364 RepID=A0A2P6NNX8_9EUKA|nr:hypothetical protein PROFUN_06503 [Planoprotostelium fungivorum]
MAVEMQTMRNIWTALNESNGEYWTGPNICNSTDYIGVTCDPSKFGPVRISLIGRGLMGYLHPDIGLLINLTSIDLSENELNGPIPDTIGQLSSLSTLRLGRNRLIGPIPDTIGRLSLLLDVWLPNNQLNHSIPSGLCRLTSLEKVNLGSNRLSGCIPDCIGNLISVNSLDLSSNLLNGSIPDSIGTLYSLSSISFGGNSWDRYPLPIPSTIGNILSLQDLHLYQNQLTGNIPESIGKLTSLTTLWLHENRLSGTIPTVLGDLKQLSNIQISSNQLSGERCDLANHQFALAVPSGCLNELYGAVPGRNVSLPGITSLNLYGNRFTSLGFINVTETCSLDEDLFMCGTSPNMSTRCSVMNGTCATTSMDPITSGTSSDNTSTSMTSDQTHRTMSITSTATKIDPNPNYVLQRLYDNNSKISTDEAKYEYNTRDVSVKLQTYNTSELSGGKSVTNKIENSNIAVTFPLSTLGSERQVSVMLSSISFNPFGSIYNGIIYSPVIGVSVYAQGKEIDVRGVDQLINITMGSITSIPSGYEAVCQYWNETHGLWSKDGCSLVVDANVTTCRCSHLTNFSIGAQPRAAATEPVNSPSQVSGSNKTKLIIIACCVVGGLLFILIVSLLAYRKVYRYKRDDTETNLSVVVDTDGIELEKMIAEGKRGQVWKSIYKETTVVAVKKLIGGIDIDRECDVMKSQGVHHPNIVQYLGQSLKERHVMTEWMNDDTLHHFLSSQPELTVDMMFLICEGVSKGLSYISSMGMVHVSVVPKKVSRSHFGVHVPTKEQILMNGMTAKWNGLSCIVAESSPCPSEILQQFYTAPEVIEDKRYTASGHVYNVGVLLWSMVTDNFHLYDTTRKEELHVQVTADERMDERVVGLITDCTKRREERPSLRELSDRVAVEKEEAKEEIHTEEVYMR